MGHDEEIMSFSDYILYQLAKRWRSPMEAFDRELNAEVGTEAYQTAYPLRQFNLKVRNGLLREVTDLDVLEIGSGHGGISCFMAAVGARRVVGIDLSKRDLETARHFTKQFSARYGPNYELPVEFLEMSADRMTFPDAEFDVVVADNAFEHFTDPEAVMRESFRVLRPGGRLLVPVFASILNKYGLHLKHGLRLPWVQLVCSERTIIRAMHRLAAANPKLLELYPGLANNPQRVRDLRRYKDLNDITYREFKAMAARIGFRVESFVPFGTRLGQVVRRIPLLRDSKIMDILSVGASACLRKPGVPATPSADPAHNRTNVAQSAN
jgi:ubiquinone/menaquinone biosynthesis C-methylase UbiE